MEHTTLKVLKDKARDLQPLVRVGKNGFTPAVMEEIKKQVKKNHLVKIKLLRSFVEAYSRDQLKELLEKMCIQASVILITKVGFIVVIASPHLLPQNHAKQHTSN